MVNPTNQKPSSPAATLTPPAQTDSTSTSSNWLNTVVPPVFVVMWSSAFVAAVFGTGAAPALLLTFSRFAIAGVLLAMIALFSRSPWPRGRMLLHVAVTGLLMQAVQFGAFYTAIGKGLPGGVVALVQGFNPVIIALLAGSVLGERISRGQWLGFGIGGIGVALAIVDQLRFSVPAVLLSLVGLLGMSFGTLYQKRFAIGADVRSSTAVHFLVSAPVVGLLSLLLETPRVTNWGAFGASVAWIVLINSVGTFLLLNLMLRRHAANRVGTLFFATPGVTAVLAWFINGQVLGPLTIIGLLLSSAGVLLASRK
jgi:drug/metabolite transporter (DMT)-like permease